jgi:hypothetical protein
MIGLKINEAFLELEANASLQIELHNPLFSEDQETGLFSYDITAPLSHSNQRTLNFPGALAVRAYRKEPWPCQLWLGERLQLFRQGKLNVLDRTGKGYRLSFQSDCRDMATAGTDLLRELDLGTATLSLSVKNPYPIDKYALFPVKNKTFYGDKNPDFRGYLNYYFNSFQANSSQNFYAITPFPYLCHLLERVFSHYGYRISGGWFNSAAAQKLCLYSIYAQDKITTGLNSYEPVIDFKNHVPEVTVGEFLKAVRKRLALAFVFNTKAREVEIVKLTDALTDPVADDWTAITQPDYDWQPNQTDGFTLEMASDSNDDLQKNTPEFLKYQVGNGKESISTLIGALEEITETDPINARTWTIPQAEQQGNSPEFDLGTDKAFGLRLFSYEGLQNGYPYGKPLQWADTTADYDNWLNFLGETETITRKVNLKLPHLLAADPKRKIIIRAPEGTIKAFWKRIVFTVSQQKGIVAKVEFSKTLN